MKHYMKRFIGGLMSFFGITELVTGANAATLCKLKDSNGKIFAYAKMTETATDTWYVLWGQYTGASVSMGGVFSTSTWSGQKLRTPLHGGGVAPASLKKYCTKAVPDNTFYSVSGLGYAIIRPQCAEAIETSNCGSQLYFADTRVADELGCCYSGATGATGGTGDTGGSYSGGSYSGDGYSGSSSSTSCTCWYAEASSENTYTYNNNTCHVLPIKPVKKCFEFINCAYGYYTVFSDSEMEPYCIETVPGLLFNGGDASEIGSGTCDIAIPHISETLYSYYDEEAQTTVYGYDKCIEDGCDEREKLIRVTNAKNFYVTDTCRSCPSDQSYITNLVSSVYDGFKLNFSTASTIDPTNTGVLYSTVGVTSCNPQGYTAKDRNGNTFEVGSCNAYKR